MLFSFLLTGPPPFQIKGDVNAIKWEILQRGPVVARLRLYEDFIYYVNGIYHVGEMIWNHIEFKIIFQHTYGNYKGFHAVKLIGWGQEKGEKYWIATNSFNQYWGMGGYFYIAEAECGIEEQIAVITFP